MVPYKLRSVIQVYKETSLMKLIKLNLKSTEYSLRHVCMQLYFYTSLSLDTLVISQNAASLFWFIVCHSLQPQKLSITMRQKNVPIIYICMFTHQTDTEKEIIRLPALSLPLIFAFIKGRFCSKIQIKVKYLVGLCVLQLG